VLDVREADFLELAGAAAAVLEVHLAERVGGDLLELGVAGACPLRGRALGRRAGEGFLHRGVQAVPEQAHRGPLLLSVVASVTEPSLMYRTRFNWGP